MPVALFTGLPGAGKTASLVKRILELIEKEPGRPIFQMGINGLKPGLAADLTPEQLSRWWELPPGSIICIDECQEDHLMPKDRGNPSEWVQRITKVRHYGMDFLLTTQHPCNMSAYVRRLVDQHVHSVMRAKGVRQTFTWMRCIDDPDSRREKRFADVSLSPLPKEVFDLYKSSSLHTMKVRTPKKVFILGGLILAGVAVIGWLVYRGHERTTGAGLAGQPATATASAKSAADSLRVSDFAKWMRPRVAGVPWSAPMFDHLEVQASPRLYCVAVDDGRCTCNTEQGTHYEVPAKQCRTIAANGIYNPFVPSSEGRGGSRPADDDQGPSPGRRGAASPPAGQGMASFDGGDGATGPQKERATAAPYTPPEYHAWMADAFGGPGAAK